MKATLFSFCALFFIVILASSCNRRDVLVRQGSYDYVFDKDIRKLTHRPKNQDAIKEIEKVYSLARERDLGLIAQLKKGGLPSDKPRIYDLYLALNNRQQDIRPLLPLHIKKQKRDARFIIEDYSDYIVEARNDAAEYYYADAQRLMNTGDKLSARKAYECLQKLQRIIPNYRDVNSLIALAKTKGQNQIIVILQNKTQHAIPRELEQELFRLNASQLNDTWAHFDIAPSTSTQYDYEALVSLENFSISPERFSEKLYRQEKQIPNGWSYVYDAKGKIKVDSLGSPIKIHHFATIFCDVREVSQQKIAEIIANIRIKDLRTGKIVEEEDLSAVNEFNHRYAQVNGHLDAAAPEVLAMTKAGPQPFPADLELVARGFESLKPKFIRALGSSIVFN